MPGICSMFMLYAADVRSIHLRLHEVAWRHEGAASPIQIEGKPHPGTAQCCDVLPILGTWRRISCRMRHPFCIMSFRMCMLLRDAQKASS